MLLRRFFSILIIACPLLGCTADSGLPSSESNQTASKEPLDGAATAETAKATEPASDPITETTSAKAETNSTATTQSSTSATAPTSNDTGTPAQQTADVGDGTVTTDDQPQADTAQKLETFNDFLEAIQAKLDGNPPTEEEIAEALALAEQGVEQLNGDPTMANVLGVLMYKTIPLEQDPQVLKQRRLRLGELARELGKIKEHVHNSQLFLLEEAKAHLADGNAKQALASVMDSRKLGFTQVEYLFVDPEFESLINNKEIQKEFKELLAGLVEEKMESFDTFDFDFTLTSFDGDKVSLADFRGKPVIVDIWGTWCPPCREVIPHLVKIAKQYQEEIAVVGINIEHPQIETSYEEAKANFEQFTKVQPINYPCLHGSHALVETIPQFLGFPTMLFFDAEGKVVLRLEGPHGLQELEVIMEKLLKQQKKVADT